MVFSPSILVSPLIIKFYSKIFIFTEYFVDMLQPTVTECAQIFFVLM